MNTHSRRRDDRSAPDPYKQWVPPDKLSHDYDPDRRRHRAATVPSHSYDPRSHPSHDVRYNDPRQSSSRPQRQDPHYPSAVHYSTSYHHPPAQAPSTSRAYQHATRTSAQQSSGYHNPQPSSYQPSHPTPAHPPATSSRRPHPEPSDQRPSRRAAPPPHQAYEHVSSGEEMARSRHTSRPAHPSTQPPLSVPSNQAFWNPPQDASSSRRHKDPYRDRDRDPERDRDRERDRDKDRDKERSRPPPELENRYKDRQRIERHRERERERERATEVRGQESSRSKHRKDSDTEEALHYSEQRNASKVSLSGREAHSTTVREPSSAHRRHRTEEGTMSTNRRLQPENMQNSITTVPSQATNVPQLDVQQTGEPPPAPRVMPVYLPPKAKSQRLQREGRPSTAQGAQSGSDTERATGKHRMERTPSGPATQRSDAYTSSSTRDRGNHDASTGPRDDTKRPEVRYVAHQDVRQPFAPINVDIPLVTPGINVSALPAEIRAPTVPQIVSIRAGQGPSDPHDAHYKSSAISHSDAPQDITVHPPHPTSASIVKPPIHTRSQSSSETRGLPDRSVVMEQPRTEPRVDDLLPGQRMSVHESNRVVPTPISKPSYSRGNPETGVENPSFSYPHSRPPSRSAHRSSINNAVPPAVVGPRPLRSASQGPQTHEPPTRPPSVAQHVPVTSVPNQHPIPHSPAQPTNGSPPRAGHGHGSPSSVQPSPKGAQLHGVTLSRSTSTHQASAPPTTHPTPVIVPQTFTTPSRPPTREGAYVDAQSTHQQLIDRQSTADSRPGLRQTSSSTTVEASWVVQTPATARKAKISREDKYLRDHRFNLETPHPQLRQVLSQEDDSFPRATSSFMKASQATTPTSSSQRNSPGTMSKDVFFGTPRGTSGSNSPKSGSAKEVPTPEYIPRQNLPPHLVGPPQIAVVGATPITISRDLPQGRVDHSLLAPPFPAPTRVSRTVSSSQDQLSQPPPPIARNVPVTAHRPPLAPVAHAPSLFQPYRPPSLSVSEDNGQFSPPPLPIPPPRDPEDSSPPPIGTRTSEIIPTRSQGDERPQSYAHCVPEVQSEMFHLPSQPSAPSQPPSAPPSRTTQNSRPSQLDGSTVPMPILNYPIVLPQADTKYSKPAVAHVDEVPVVHEEIMVSIPFLPSQSSVPTRSRPKVTIEDVPEDSPVLSKPTTTVQATSSVLTSRSVQSSQHNALANVNLVSQPGVVDQPAHKSSPQSRSKEPPPHRGIDPGNMGGTPLMPPPISAAAPMSTRVPSSAPAAQPTFFPSAQAAPAQRVASQTVPSRTYQRAAEMLQTSKLSTSTGSNTNTTGNANKSTTAPVTPYNPTIIGGQFQSMSGASVQGSSSSRPAYATATAPIPNASVATSAPRASPLATTVSSGPPAGTLGLHMSAPSITVHTQSSIVPDTAKQPLSRPPLSIPSVDAPPTILMSTTVIKNAHHEQPAIESTRTRDPPSATRNIPPSSHLYPISARPTTSSAMTQLTHVAPAQPSTHHRVVSLPTTSSSSAAQKPPSPRKSSQPILSSTVSTQPFPSRPSVPESQPIRPPISAHAYTPAPVRSARLTPPDRMNDLDVLKTPSSIAPSPMLNPDTSNPMSQSTAIPVRARQSSTDSKDDKKKPSGLFGIFRARTLSSKATDPPAIDTPTRASLDQGRVHLGASVTAAPAARGVTPATAVRGLNFAAPPVTTSTYARTQTKSKGRDPVTILPTHAAREQRDATPHMFTPFKFLSMHSKRNRTVSAASLDVCDGNTATNTVIGSPDHSTVSQAQPLPPIVPPDVRDPLVATSEWRDREEADRRERKKHRIRRPGVTFDVEEEPPSPAPGTVSKRKKLVRRGSGRAPTPGPLRG